MGKIKKYLSFIVVIELIAILLTACSEDASDSYFDPANPNITLDSGPIRVGKEGGEISISVKSNLPWRAKAEESWINIGNQRGEGDGTIKATININRTIEERSDEITVWINDEYKKSILVVQDPSSPSELVEHYYVKADASEQADGLSWANATSLDNALEKAVGGDYIHIAEGTYSPSRTITNGKVDDAKDKTFEIHSNITMIGGYPANATEGTQPDHKQYETILSGIISGDRVYHVVSITAPVQAGAKVVMQGLTIKNGKAASSGTGSVSVNGASYYRFYAGGVIVARSTVEMTDCIITENESGYHAGGMYIFTNAHVTMERCIVDGNKGTSTSSNCAGIYNDASTLIINNSSVINNSTTGVAGGIYAFNSTQPTYTYIYNSTISGNNNDALGFNQGRKGGGFYGRENSVTVMVNTTIHSNIGGVGAGIGLHGPAGKEAKLDLINCTITGNTALKNNGAYEGHNDSMIKFFNCVISGNGGTMEGSGPATFNSTIFGNNVLDKNGNIVTGLSFDPLTMIAPLADNGGYTKTALLIGSGNPAKDNGLTSDELRSLGDEYNPAIDASVITYDQIGLSRSGAKTMGACIK